MASNAGPKRPANFHCDICNKDYARFPEFAAHEKSYEHNHTKRRKDLERMTTSKALSGARKDPQLRVLGAEGGEKKAKKVAGFTAVGGTAGGGEKDADEEEGVSRGFRINLAGKNAMRSAEDEGAGVLGKAHMPQTMRDGAKPYNPFKPTGCGPDCPCLTAGG